MTTVRSEAAAAISVAIVDDDASVRIALRRLCNALGLRATAFESGIELVDALHAGAPRPDCLVLDTQMPQLTGLETLRRLEACGVRLPTVVVSADDTPETRAHYLAAGVSDYLRKPVGATVLLTAIEHAVRLAQER